MRCIEIDGGPSDRLFLSVAIERLSKLALPVEPSLEIYFFSILIERHFFAGLDCTMVRFKPIGRCVEKILGDEVWLGHQELWTYIPTHTLTLVDLDIDDSMVRLVNRRVALGRGDHPW